MKKTNLLSKIVIIAFMVIILTAFAIVATAAETYSGTCGAEGDGSNLVWSLDTDTGVLDISGTGAMADWNNQSSVPWSSYRGYIKSVVIGNSVTSIGTCAFQDCVGLTSVMIGNGIESIGSFAFNGCTGLTSITVDKANTVYHSNGNCLIETASKILIAGCKNSTIPNDQSVTSIGDYAFSGCSALTNIDVPDSVTSIGRGAFSHCTGLTSINLGNGVTSIENRAFWSSALTSIDIPDSVTSIGYNAFAETPLRIVNISSSVTIIDEYAFSWCSSLTDIIIRSENVDISDGLLAFSDNATIHGYEGSTAQAYAEKDGKAFVAIREDTIGGTCGAEGDGSNLTWTLNTETGVLNIEGTGAMADMWGDDENDELDIPWCANRNYIYIKSVVIENGVTSIGDVAFYGCSALTNIDIPDSVMNIGEGAFIECCSLTSIEIPDKVTSIGKYAFYECLNLTSIEIPNSVTSIGQEAFSYCSNLTDIVIWSKDVTIYNHTATISDTATIYGYAGSTAQAYAEKYSRTFIVIPEILDNITVLEANAIYTPTPDSEGVDALISYQKGDAVFDLLYADKATGVLKFKTATGDYEALYSKDGSVLSLGTTPVSLAVIYDDIRGTVRYFVNGFVPYYGIEESRVLANDIAVNAEFVNAEGSEKTDLLEGAFNDVKMYNIHDSGTAEIVAFQDHTESNNIRILSCVDMPWYSTVGFDVEVYIDGVGQGEKTLCSNTIFESVIANNVEVFAKEEYGYNYFAAVEIDDVDVTDENAYYIITKPFARVGSTKYFGKTAKIDIDADGKYSFDENYN